MSESTTPIEAITGSVMSPSHFDWLDMKYRVRMRAFVSLCMPPVFSNLESQIKMMALRKQGYAPIMYFLDFRSGTTPIAFGRALENSHTLRLCRSAAEQRVFLHSRSVLRAKSRSHGPEALGYDDGSGAMVEAGTAEALHVITRPMAPPGERQVTTAPEELRLLKEHAWDGPMPSIENLSVPPEGYERLDLGAWAERTDVWGIPNTDINQHVNVQEYVRGGENAFTRALHGAGLPIARHHITRARLVFRRPFFPGQTYMIRATLYRRDNATQLQAGYYALENGKPAERPSSFLVYDGIIEDENAR